MVAREKNRRRVIRRTVFVLSVLALTALRQQRLAAADAAYPHIAHPR